MPLSDRLTERGLLDKAATRDIDRNETASAVHCLLWAAVVSVVLWLILVMIFSLRPRIRAGEPCARGSRITQAEDGHYYYCYGGEGDGGGHWASAEGTGR